MGAWGTGSFENDWAMDWIDDLRDSQDASPIRAALSRVVDHGDTKRRPVPFWSRAIGCLHKTDWLAADAASQALAAAEIVAAWLGHPPCKFPDGIHVWSQTHAPKFQPELVSLARQAVTVVKTNSELKDLWEEGDVTEWRAAIEDLEKRLQE